MPDPYGRSAQAPRLLQIEAYTRERLDETRRTRGDSFGVAWYAEPTYIELISRFESFQVGIALRSFMARKIRNKLD